MTSTATRVGTKVFLRVFNENPRLAVVVYSIFFLGTAVGLFFTIKHMMDFPDRPIAIAIQDVPAQGEKEIWAELTGVRAKCDELLATPDDYVVPLIDDSGSFLLAYQPVNKNCDPNAMVFTGVIQKIHPKYYDFLSQQNFPIIRTFSADHVWSLCAGCSPSDSKLGVYALSALLLLFGWGIFHWGKMACTKPTPSPQMIK